MARQKKVVRSFPTLDVVAMACAAQRINGAYIKAPYQLGGDNPRKTNRELVYKFIDDQSVVTDNDRQMAEDVKQFYKGYTFKVLSGDYISEFDRNIMKILEDENCEETGYNIAILASIPSVYLKAKQRKDADIRVRSCEGGYVGKVGERLSLTVEVFKSVFSQKYGIWFISAVTINDQAVFFSYKQELNIGSSLDIDGTVKRQDNNQTQLNRVTVK